MKFFVLIEEGEDNFSAYIPELPGCVATGDTIEETKELIVDAAVAHVELMEQDGLPLTGPSVSGLVLHLTPTEDGGATDPAQGGTTYKPRLVPV